MARFAPWVLLAVVVAVAAARRDEGITKRRMPPAAHLAEVPRSSPIPPAPGPGPRASAFSRNREEIPSEVTSCEMDEDYAVTIRKLDVFLAELADLVDRYVDSGEVATRTRLSDEISRAQKKIERYRSLLDAQCGWNEIRQRYPRSMPPLEILAAARVSFDLDKETVEEVLRRLGVRVEAPVPDGRPRSPLAVTDVSGLETLSLIAAREGWSCEFRVDSVRLTRIDGAGTPTR